MVSWLSRTTPRSRNLSTVDTVDDRIGTLSKGTFVTWCFPGVVFLLTRRRTVTVGQCRSSRAVARAAESPTTVVGEDTDLLVLLICHPDQESHTLYMQSDKKKGKKFRVWDIHWFQRSLGTEMSSLLSFAHAIGGCDTTSHLFGIGKGVPL